MRPCNRMYIAALLLTGLLCATVAGAAEPEAEVRTIRVDWRSAFQRHAWAENGLLKLRSTYALDSSKVLHVEAERASVASCKNNGGERPSDDCCGGSYMHEVERLEFFLDVQQEGRYQTWYRMRVRGTQGSTSHIEGIDASLGASVGLVRLEVEPGKWLWIKGRVWRIKTGLHELQMDQWSEGVDIDRIAVTADLDWEPGLEARQTPAASPQPWRSGTCFTSDVTQSLVLQWRKVGLSHLALNGGSAVLSASTDGGGTWERVAEDGDLSGLPVRADGTDRIRFRVQLKRAPDGRSPEVGPLMLTYVGKRDDLFTIEDKLARFYFARKTGALCGIENRATRTMLTPLRHPTPLFRLQIKPVGDVPQKDWKTVTSLDAQCLKITHPEGARSGAWQFAYELSTQDGKASVRIECKQTAEGELSWTGHVANRFRGTEIVSITYPVVDAAKVSENALDDTILMTGNYLVRKPASFGTFLFYWPVDTAPLMDLFNAREGIALTAHDNTMRSTGICFKGLERRAVEMSLIKYVRVKPGQDFSCHPHLLRLHTGDWHATALKEREWLARNRPAPDTPLWLREADGWIPAGWPCPYWADLGEYAAHMRRLTGLNYINFWNYQISRSWTIPAPNPVNGTEQDARWGIEQAHRAGLRVTFYIQGLLYDPEADGSSPDDPLGYLHRRDLWPGLELPPEGFAESNAARDADGNTHSWSEHELEMCYAAKGFQEFKRHWAIDVFMKKLRADGIYWDSLSRGRLCWAQGHGHGDDPGMWGVGALENHMQIRREAKQINPEAVFGTEGRPTDTLWQATDIHLDNAPNLEVVRFLFPQMLIYLGSADGADPTRRKAHLIGCRFDGIDPYAPDQRKLLWIRRRVNQYLYPATPMDTLGLEISNGEGVQGKLFMCDAARTRGAVVNFLNPQGIEGAVAVVDTSRIGPVRTAWVADASGQDQPLQGGRTVSGGTAYRFAVPSAFASTVLLLSSAEPRVTVGEVEPIAQGGSTSLKIRVESLTGDRVRGTIRLLLPAGLSSEPQPFDVSGAGEDGQVLRFAIGASEDAPLGLRGHPVEVAVQGGPRFQRVVNIYVERPVRATLSWCAPNRLRAGLLNRSGQRRRGSLSVRIGSGTVRFAEENPTWSFDLAPGASASFEVPLEGGLRTDLPWTVRGSLEYGTLREPLYGSFRPPICNGSLERYEFRTDVPDYWWGTFVDKSPKIWGKGEYSIDGTIAADGKRSLKLIGKPDEWRGVNLDIALKPRTRYRFHVQIRRTAHAPGIYAAIYEARRTPDGQTGGVSHAVGKKTSGPLNEWETFETSFVSLPEDEMAGARLYLYNMNSPAVVWFDDIRLVPESAPGEGTE